MGADRVKAENKRQGMWFYILAFLIALVILLTMLGTMFYFIVKNNVNGITEKHRSVLRVIPIIKNAVGDDTEYGDGIDYLGHYELKQMYRELVKKYDQLQKSHDQAMEDIKSLQEENSAYLDKFREYESQAEKLDEERERLEQDIRNFHLSVAKQERDAFIEYFEQINEETAKEVYEEFLMEREAASRKKDIADIFAGMDPEYAADIISELGNSNMDTIIDIFASMSKNSVASILEQIEPALASEITLRLYQLADTP